MKKIIITISSIAIAVIATSFVSFKNFAAKKVSRQINVEVYKDAAYNSPAYNDTYATLNITVLKINGDKRDTAFTHDYASTQLKNFPSVDKPLMSKITVNNINDKQETLEVYYTLTYDTKGSRLSFSDVKTIGNAEKSGSLSIKI